MVHMLSLSGKYPFLCECVYGVHINHLDFWSILLLENVNYIVLQTQHIREL